ncbi:hypothetical protein IFM53868_05423 [Aspergillus udagawae]|uniref:Uncharacterized protein n=1 Tax=Aspergillus udagawae TaxID=91492 RepID=A0ABQ1AUC2_9EURO|nr:hypothetical protein IFM53868_05423 [Aspergillus udagawae]
MPSSPESVITIIILIITFSSPYLRSTLPFLLFSIVAFAVSSCISPNSTKRRVSLCLQGVIYQLGHSPSAANCHSDRAIDSHVRHLNYQDSHSPEYVYYIAPVCPAL